MTLPSGHSGAPSAPSANRLITLEEPTGIYRRDLEVVTTRVSFEAGEARVDGLRVVNAENRVVTSQAMALETHGDGSVKTAELLFRASIIPGERPQFRVVNDRVAENARNLRR